MDREAEITKNIELLRRKNEAWLQRHNEIENDRKKAEQSGRSVNVRNPSEQSWNSDKQRKGSGSHPRTQGFQTHAHMDEIYDEERERRDNRPSPNYRGRGRGEHGNDRSNHRGRGGRGVYQRVYGAKRLANFQAMEEELAQGNAEGGTSRFLDDPRRKGELNTDEKWKSMRHRNNYGGINFSNSKQDNDRHQHRNERNQNRHNRGKGMSKLQMTAEMTGKERQDQERWQAMRDAADKEIQGRSKTSDGQWRREWDAKKVGFSESCDDQGTLPEEEFSRRDHYGSRPRRGMRARGGGRRGGRISHNVKDRRKQDKKDDRHASSSSTVEEAVEAQSSVTNKAEVDQQPVETKEKQQWAAKSHVKRTQNKTIKNERGVPSPRHVMQQRANTPSSKDGTEVWAQNSHHSDEAGPDWKNGANRSTEQWLPSDEGNRNPAIDERMLEQQEGGATVYSRQLGRGWGDEKNLKATKAWVIDTEKAGLPNPISDSTAATTEETVKKSDRKSRTPTARVLQETKDVTDKTRFRSASPRLKRENPGLTVEIKNEQRRVKHHSESEAERGVIKKANNEPDTENIESQLDSSLQSPLSDGIMKTPEGVVPVPDWAAEVEMLSPTYISKQKSSLNHVIDDIESKVTEDAGNKPPLSTDNQEKHTSQAFVEENPVVLVEADIEVVDSQTCNMAVNKAEEKEDSSLMLGNADKTELENDARNICHDSSLFNIHETDPAKNFREDFLKNKDISSNADETPETKESENLEMRTDKEPQTETDAANEVPCQTESVTVDDSKQDKNVEAEEESDSNSNKEDDEFFECDESSLSVDESKDKKEVEEMNNKPEDTAAHPEEQAETVTNTEECQNTNQTEITEEETSSREGRSSPTEITEEEHNDAEKCKENRKQNIPEESEINNGETSSSN